MYYLGIAALLLPWCLYFLGAALRTALQHRHAAAAQLLCASTLLLGSATLWLLYDPNFGLDPYRTKDWTHAVERIEGWLFPWPFFCCFASSWPT